MYDSRFSLPIQERIDLEDRIDLVIYEVMNEWAETIPESILELYGPYLIQIRALCITRKPSHYRIYIVLNEIHIIYKNEDFIDTFIILTPEKVHIEHSDYSLRSKAFPLTWTNEPLSIPSYTSLESKLCAYKEFLDSNELRYLIVLYNDQEDPKQLLRVLQLTPFTIQCMVEGEPTIILDTDISSSNMYEEPLPIKHIIHRKSFDSFAKTVLAMEDMQCSVIEFK